MKKTEKKPKKIETKKDAGRQLAKQIREVLLDKKAEDVLILDLRELSSVADYFVIASGTSTRHVDALGENVQFELKQQGQPARKTEGLGEGTWVLLDFSDVIVHIFYHETRNFYQLEKLWEDAPLVK